MNTQELKRLEQCEKRIREIASEEGLLTTDILFELVPAQRMIEAMAYHFPTNFSHWSFGRDFERHRTIYDYTGSGIPYEVVWNFENPRAFLVETNPFALNVLIMCHVVGHVDFFLGSNFLKKGRDIADIAQEARGARKRFEEYERRYGTERYERVVEAAMSLQWLQDPDPFAEDVDDEDIRERLMQEARARFEPVRGLTAHMHEPPSEEEIEKQKEELRGIQLRTPPVPTYDVLGYILRNSPKPLRKWEIDIISVVRKQAQHLLMGARTKLLNEGWATYWHVRIMRQLFEEGLLTAEEHGVFNKYHSGVLRENKYSLNWYRTGLALYEDVKERWDKGRFGKEYEECRSSRERSLWDTGVGEGTEKIFQVRSSYSDRMSIEELFTDDFISAQQLYIWAQRVNPQTREVEDVIVEKRPHIIRSLLKRQYASLGNVLIQVDNGNDYDNRELFLRHVFSGFELNPRFEEGALEHVFRLWGRAVRLETFEFESVNEAEGVAVFSRIIHKYDGKMHSILTVQRDVEFPLSTIFVDPRKQK